MHLHQGCGFFIFPPKDIDLFDLNQDYIDFKNFYNYRYVYTGWSELKHPYSELSIHPTTQRKSSKIVEHVIQDMGKRIIRKKN